MNARYFSLLASICLLFAVAGGCQKSEPFALSAPYPVSNDTVARIHWLGKRRLGVEAGAYYFMRIWQVPASEQLQAQTLNKLSPFFSGPRSPVGATATRPPAIAPEVLQPLLRSFLNDIVREECFLEIRQSTGHPFEYAFAIRLEDVRAGFWETNAAVLAQCFTAGTVTRLAAPSRGWFLERPRAPNRIGLTRMPGWVVLSASEDKSTLLDDVLSRIRNYREPFGHSATNYWLEAAIEPQRAAKALALDWNLPANAPRISVSVSGDGVNVLAHSELTFPARPQIEPEPWNIPTNLIREPLSSFTAARGIKPLLAVWQPWNDLQFGPPPDQIYFWSETGPFQTFFAAPVPDAANRVHQLTSRLLNSVNPWLSARGYVSFAPIDDSNGVTWGNLSYMQPFVTSSRLDTGEMVFGGLLADSNRRTNPPVTGQLLRDFATQTNLLYYDWEITGKRVEPWLQIAQITRAILRRSQLPLDSTAANWLGTIKIRLGESTTRILQTGPNQLSFDRKSTIGLTAPELHLLIDWLESPDFPRGLHTTLIPPPSAP